MKFLLAFDFDHTLIDENSDFYVIKLAPGGKVPDEISNLYSAYEWSNYMGEIFKYLHKNGNTPENILDCLAEIPLTEGMTELLDRTRSSGLFDHIIISDANSVFIKQILHKKQLSETFLQTFTNPSQFEVDGCLTIKSYHNQDWCSLSTENLCKGHILQQFISERERSGVTYSHIVYVGDGLNDLCPGLTLGAKDCLMPRSGFKLESLIDKMMHSDESVPRTKLEAQVLPWDTGLDIAKHLETLGMLKG